MITDPNGLALLFLSFIAAWPEPRSELPARATRPSQDLINTAVWGYQLYLFHERVLGQWGEQVLQQVKQAHSQLLGADCSNDLSTMTSIITDAIRQGMPEIDRLLRNGGDRGTAIDLTVALALLPPPLSPVQASAGQQERRTMITEYQLADCLGHGRERIETAIMPLIANLEMTGDAGNASLSTALQSPLNYHGKRT